MVDFSNLLRERPAMIGRRFEKRRPISDEALLDAVERIEPPFFSPEEHAALVAFLLPKRGRPRKTGPTRAKLIRRLNATDRPDVPRSFRRALASRLTREKGLRAFDQIRPLQRRFNKRERDSVIYTVYRDIYASLDGGPVVHHPILGSIVVPRGAMTRRDKAALMTQWVLNHCFAMRAPSPRTMLNIISRQRQIPR
jgi:hypothetical protein